MKSDEIITLIENDEGILLYGFTLYEKGGDSSFNEISSKLRGLSRLVLQYRQLFGSDASSFSMIDPGSWDNVIQAAKALVGCQKQKVGLPSLLLGLGRSLACLASAKRAIGIRLKDDNMVNDARSFLELHATEWSIYSKHAQDAMKKDNIPEDLPLSSDIDKLKDYLLQQTSSLSNVDEEIGMTKLIWSKLQFVTLARIIIFNARRGSEPSKLTMSQWENSDIWKRQEDIDNLEDPIEKALAKRLKVVYVTGKRKRRVPIIFTPEVAKDVNLLIKYRYVVGVCLENQYIFARPSRGSTKFVRGWDVLNDVSQKANLEKPELITSTKIRKHIATVLQLMVLNKAELSWITDHLGHSAAVHKQWYRQEPSTIELTKVDRVLMAKDAGKCLKNKKVSDLEGKVSIFLFF